jgi:hypothetical protein
VYVSQRLVLLLLMAVVVLVLLLTMKWAGLLLL